MNKSTILKDYDGNVLYPKTLHENVIGLPSITDKTKIFFGSGTPSSNKSAFSNPEENDIYINTDAENRQGYFYVLTRVVDSIVVWGHTYGNYTVQNVTPPNTTIGYYLYDVPLLREGLLWLDSSHNKIFICIGTSGSIITWKELTDFYTKSEVDALFDELQFKINKKAKPVIETVTGSSITLEDSSNRDIKELTFYGKSTQNGTPSIDNPVAIEDVSNESISFSNGAGSNFGELSKTLRGIPIQNNDSNYNYVDSNGQRWMCDTIEKYKDGTGKLIQRIRQIVYDGTQQWNNYTGDIVYSSFGTGNTARISTDLYKRSFCSHFYTLKRNYNQVTTDDNTYTIASSLIAISPTINGTRLNRDEFKTWLSTNNMTLEYVLETPVETPLTEEELAELDLATYKPITNIVSNTDVTVTYVADTKNYIDKRMAELQNAIISQGGNV